MKGLSFICFKMLLILFGLVGTTPIISTDGDGVVVNHFSTPGGLSQSQNMQALHCVLCLTLTPTIECGMPGTAQIYGFLYAKTNQFSIKLINSK